MTTAGGGRPRLSAGILLFRRRGDVTQDGAAGPSPGTAVRSSGAAIEVLIGHPGGPYFVTKDAGYWSIPKGEVEPGEELVDVALREFEEETGFPVPGAREALIPLGDIVQKGGKQVVAWAAEGDLDPAEAHSNTFSIEWPPRSGRSMEIPEIDRVAWFAPDDARRMIKATQIPLIDRLEAALAGDETPIRAED